MKQKTIYDKLDSAVVFLTFVGLAAAIMMAIFDVGFATHINQLQMRYLTRSSKIYPVVTALLLMVPLLVLLLPLKLYLNKKRGV